MIRRIGHAVPGGWVLRPEIDATGPPCRVRPNHARAGYQRTLNPVTALPMTMRWISDVPSKIVKLVEVRAVFRSQMARWCAACQHQLSSEQRQLRLRSHIRRRLTENHS
jgi:hypothetical protein